MKLYGFANFVGKLLVPYEYVDISLAVIEISSFIATANLEENPDTVVCGSIAWALSTAEPCLSNSHLYLPSTIRNDVLKFL